VKNPQGREAKKPKKSKVKAKPQTFENVVRKTYQGPDTEIDPNAPKN
jgi:hypothetical protein